MNIGERIKQRRVQLGLTLQDVAMALGVNASTVSRYETAEIGNMGIDKIEKLAAVLSCSPGLLMGWEAPVLSEEKMDPGPSLYQLLDSEDRAEIRGIIKQMLKSPKYTK